MTQTRREKLYNYIIKKLILKSSQLAYARDDLHQYTHLIAALKASTSSGKWHTEPCDYDQRIKLVKLLQDLKQGKEIKH